MQYAIGVVCMSLVSGMSASVAAFSQPQAESASAALLQNIESQIVARRGANRANYVTALNEIATQEGGSQVGLRARELLIAIHLETGGFQEADQIVNGALQLTSVASDARLSRAWLSKSIDVARSKYDREGPTASPETVSTLLERYQTVIDRLSPQVFRPRQADDHTTAFPEGYTLLTQSMADLAVVQVAQGMNQDALNTCDSAFAGLLPFRAQGQIASSDAIEESLRISRGAALLGLSRPGEALLVLESCNAARRDVVALNVVTRAKRAAAADKAEFGLSYLSGQPLPFSVTQMSLALLTIEAGEDDRVLAAIDRLLSAENQQGLDAMHRLRPSRPGEGPARLAPSAESKFARFQLLVRKLQLIGQRADGNATAALRQAILQEFADSPGSLQASGLLP
jgi:hypothetical protein